jgi:hypothetical protein
MLSQNARRCWFERCRIPERCVRGVGHHADLGVSDADVPQTDRPTTAPAASSSTLLAWSHSFAPGRPFVDGLALTPWLATTYIYVPTATNVVRA